MYLAPSLRKSRNVLKHSTSGSMCFGRTKLFREHTQEVEDSFCVIFCSDNKDEFKLEHVLAVEEPFVN